MKRSFILLLAVYLGITAISRGLLWSHLEYDDAEQIVLVQTLAAGYSAQPPLYTWLLWPVVQVLGVSVYPLLLVRTLLRGAILVLVYCLARRLLVGQVLTVREPLPRLPNSSHDRLAMLAAFTLVLLPELNNSAGKWTHTLLLTALTLATVIVVLHALHQPGRSLSYLLLGVLAGLGVLAKYNYVHFAAALVLALLTLPAGRRLLWNRRLLLTMTVALLIAGPHLAWMREHSEEVRSSIIAHTLDREERYQSWPGLLLAVTSNLTNVTVRGFGLLLLPLLPFFLGAYRLTANRDGQDERTLLFRLMLAGWLLIGVLLALSPVRYLRLHWLTPFAILAPIWFVAQFRGQVLAEWRVRGCAAALLLVTAGILTGNLTVTLRHSEQGRLGAEDFLYADLAARLRALDWQAGQAVVDHPSLAAYVRLYFPQTRVRCLFFRSQPLALEQNDQPLLAAWHTYAGSQPPARMRTFLAEHYRNPTLPLNQVRFAQPKRSAPLGVGFVFLGTNVVARWRSGIGFDGGP